MPQSQEVKEWPGLWAVRGVETGGSDLHPVGGNLWVFPIVPLLDGDDAGRSACRKIANNLIQHPSVQVYRIELPQGLDPDDLSDTDLTHRLHPFFS